MLGEAVVILVVIRLVPIWRFGLLHGWWKYTGASDLLDIIGAVGTGSVVFVAVVHFLIPGFPRPIYLLEPLLTVGLLSGVRVFSRCLAELMRENVVSAKRVLLVGAGRAAQILINELRRPESGYLVLGCLDDDSSKLRIRLGGVPVLGRTADVAIWVDRLSIDEVLIAIPSASGKQMQKFVQNCERAGVRFKTVPALRDVIDGRVSVSVFRDVCVEDLLGREPVQMNLASVRDRLDGKVVAVTGAAGSIGSEICRQVLDYAPSVLLCIDQSETGTFYLERELSVHRSHTARHFFVADVGEGDRMRKLFSEYHPDVVFHAAAYKHVPVMESNVVAAVNNNVLALLELLDVAEESGCKSFLLISSDKAVNPTNVMGATKRLGELIIARRPSGSMRTLAVRFGNVLGSSGSVIPILQEQLRNGKALTITHPEIKRFFMTIREAVSLVLQGFAIGNQGDVLVLDMGDPVAIVDLARTLVRLSGKKEEQVDIVFTGLRPGEKLMEELFYVNETVQETACRAIKKACNVSQGWSELQAQLDELRAALYANGPDTIRLKLKEIVPEYLFSAAVKLDHLLEPRRASVGA